MMKAILIRPDGAVLTKELSGFKALNHHFDGLVQIVCAPNLPEPFCLALDEEGKLKELPVNGIGSWLYRSSAHGDYIVGDVFILKIEDGPDGEDIVGLSDEDIRRIAEHCHLDIQGS